jgi:hypothetical protein
MFQDATRSLPAEQHAVVPGGLTTRMQMDSNSLSDSARHHQIIYLSKITSLRRYFPQDGSER